MVRALLLEASPHPMAKWGLVWHKESRMFSIFCDEKHAGYLCLLGLLVTPDEGGGQHHAGEKPQELERGQRAESRWEEGQGDPQLGSSANHFSSAAEAKLRACWNGKCV